MIQILNNAHADSNPGGGYELFIDRYITSTAADGAKTQRKERVGGLFYATLSGVLNGYVEQHLKSLAADTESFSLKQVREEIANLKKELTETYNMNV